MHRYVFSLYKTFGPHLAALYGRHAVLEAVKAGAPNHFFVPLDQVVYKFELGSASHEGCAGVVALAQYLQHMAGVPPLPSQPGQGGHVWRGSSWHMVTGPSPVLACSHPCA